MSIIGKDGGWEERCLPPSLKKSRVKRKKKWKDRIERSRALSCRPGSQIRRGLKTGLDCV